MRITGGKYSGRRIQCPKGIIRPAMDRMRESLFSILGPLDGTSFLDLFSGSGILGIEAASRGAEPVVLVEKDKIKAPVIRKNTAFVESAISLHIMPAQVFIRSCKQRFDYIFLDPPFPLARKTALIELVAAKKILAVDGILMLHYPQEDSIEDIIGGLECFDTRRYGRSILKFFRHQQYAEQ